MHSVMGDGGGLQNTLRLLRRGSTALADGGRAHESIGCHRAPPLDLAGPAGLSASVSFDAHGEDRRVEVFLSTDQPRTLYR